MDPRTQLPAEQTIPADLRQIIGNRHLLRLALEATLTVDWTQPCWRQPLSGDLRPQMMVTLLCYCYSAGIYGSEDVESAIDHDATVRYICAKVYPDWQAVRRFRREHRELITRCLTQVLRAAAEVSDKLSRDPGQAEQSALRRIEAASIMDRLASDV